jgi:5-methylcytosine-specific restriction protein A
MPWAPGTACVCGGVKRQGRCDRCDRGKRARDTRKSAAERGYGWKWRNPDETGAADYFIKANPLCIECNKAGIVTAATDVDHIIPHRGNMELFWDSDNWQALCKRHHCQKTARGE